MFGTKQPVMMLTGSGTAGMEAAVVNLLSPGDEVLNVVSGKFGERWADMCERFGAKVTRLNVDWGHAVSLDRLEQELRARPNLRAVFCQACETSTATLHPIREISGLIRRTLPEALFAVDAITAVGCLPLPMDEWELDVVVGGSQKAFMIPPGLALIALSERAWRAQARARAPKYYLDLEGERRANQKNEKSFHHPNAARGGSQRGVKSLAAKWAPPRSSAAAKFWPAPPAGPVRPWGSARSRARPRLR